MSAMPARLSFMKQHYEKLILVVMLLGLLASAAILVQRISSGTEALRHSAVAATPGADQAFAPPDFTAVSNALRQLTQPWQAADRSNRLFVSELRVYDQNCLKWIPWNATTCYYCGAVQKGVADEKETDSDVDSMPDLWEQKFGFDPYNRDDARLDRDADGFTNAEECKANTDPTDPKSSPPIFAKLRLRGVQTTTFQLRFLAVQKLSETDLRFQLNAHKLDMTYFKKLGDTVEGYTLDSYDKASDTLVLKKGAALKRLGRGKVYNDDQVIVKFVFLIDGKEFTCKVNEVFTLREQRAQLVELAADRSTARIRLIDGGREYLIGRPTTDEENDMQLRARSAFGLEMPASPMGVPSTPPANAGGTMPPAGGGGGLR